MDASGAAFALAHRLRKLTADLDRFALAFADRNGLHPTDLRALLALLDADRTGTAATPGWLAAELGLGSAATTAVLDRLVRAGHVERAADQVDRRRVLIRVQEQARYLGWSYFGPLVGRLAEPMGAFADDELAAVERFLSTMSDAVETRLDR